MGRQTGRWPEFTVHVHCSASLAYLWSSRPMSCPVLTKGRKEGKKEGGEQGRKAGREEGVEG